MAASCTTLLKRVSPEDIFNLPLYEHYLVIDTRTREDYDSGHIATAVSYPYTVSSRREQDTTLIDFARDYAREFYKPENPNPLLIYGNGTQHELEHTQWLADKLSQLKIQRSRLTTYSYQISVERQEQTLEEEFDSLEEFCQTVIDKVQEIWLLEGTYQTFSTEYPFLCGRVKFEEMFPLPHQVTRHVFMGSRVVPMSHDSLAKMGISHMIVSEQHELDELEDILILKCSVKDKNDENMIPCWEVSCKFIENAVLAGGRVLILLHGRSRSASIVLAYLMKNLGMDFESSWQHLRKKCWHLIDRSLVYEVQLYKWQELQLTFALPER